MPKLRKLQAKKFIRQLSNSYTSPFLVLAQDGNLYVTKPNTIDREDLELLAAELLATELGKLLGLPVPDWAIIEITESMTTSRFSTMGGAPKPGEYFGSMYLGNATTLADPAEQHIPRRPISNAADAPKCLAFDALTENVDRHANNVMLVLENGGVKVYLIDHGHVLGGRGWPALSNPAKSKLYKSRSPNTLAAAFSVDQAAMTEEARGLCSSLTKEVLEYVEHLVHLSSQIPALWWNGKPSDTFTSFIQKRAPHLYELID